MIIANAAERCMYIIHDIDNDAIYKTCFKTFVFNRFYLDLRFKEETPKTNTSELDF